MKKTASLLFVLFGVKLLNAQSLQVDEEKWDVLVEIVCLNDLELFKQGVQELTASWPGDSAARVKLFYTKYIYELTCPKKALLNGGSGCSHAGGLNLLQTAINDFGDPIVNYIIDSTGYDFYRLLPSGTSTFEWLKNKALNGPFPTEYSKKYYRAKYCRVIKCKGVADFPKEWKEN